MQREQRLKRELLRISQKPPLGISLSQKDDTNFTVLEAVLIGPDESPYKDGIFRLEITVPENYPFSPPAMKFLTKVYHPNIDDNGRICLDLLKMPPKGGWKPTISLEGLLIAVRMLLQHPNPDDPLMAEVGFEYKQLKSEFEKKARVFTEKYAK